MANWAAIEADFQREYGFDLNDAVFVAKISLRRFLVLLGGLSPRSWWAYLNSAEAADERPRVLEGQALEDFFDSFPIEGST